MIDIRYHELPDWTETVRNEPILSGTDIDNTKDTRFRVLDNINATKLIMSHHIVACEEFYVHNNIVIYLERKKTVPEPDFLQYEFMLHHTTPQKCIDIDRTLKMQPFVISSGDKISKLV